MSKEDGVLLEVRKAMERSTAKIDFTLYYSQIEKNAAVIDKLDKLITNMPSGIEHALKNYEEAFDWDKLDNEPNDEHLRLFGRQIHHTLAEAAEQFYDAVREKTNE